VKRKFTFTSEACRLADVRHCVRSFLKKCAFDECATELLVLGLDEACTNIIRHAYNYDGKPVRLEMERLRDRVRFTLRDYGRSCKPECIRSRDLEDFRPGGVGVHIIRKVFDYVNYEPCRRGTRLVLEKNLAGKPGVLSTS
jgi:anti-sigma regulatory factor (Ser/Thr protein kinase)